MRLEQEFLKVGYFWLPGNEERRLPGTLRIADGGEIELEVVGLFDKSIQALNAPPEIGRIIGTIENDGLVTLEDCFYTKRNFAFGGITKSKIHVQRVLVGAAWGKGEPVTFNSLSFTVECFDDWLGVSGITVDSKLEKGEVDISYKRPENINFKLNNGMELQICFGFSSPGVPVGSEVRLTQRAGLKLISYEPESLSVFTELAYKITNLLCFAIDATVSLKNVVAKSSELLGDLGNGDTYQVPIKVYYPSIPFAEEVPEKQWFQMLFRYRQIESNAQDVLKNWLSAYDIIAPALSLYFSTKIGAHKYLDGKFLALAQGLETYHRRTSDEKLMPQSEFESLMSELVESCPESRREWLEGRLMYGNEISLRKRLCKIVEPFKDWLGDKADRKRLLTKIVDTRNYLTHYDERLKRKAAQGEELWVLCQKMEVIFQLHFLKVLRFTEEEIESVIENCHPLKRKITEI